MIVHCAEGSRVRPAWIFRKLYELFTELHPALPEHRATVVERYRFLPELRPDSAGRSAWSLVKDR